MRTLVVAALACVIAAPAGADTPTVIARENGDLIKSYDAQLYPIRIEFEDKVTDGCLPNPSAIKTTMELSLRSARIRPVYEFSPWQIYILATGNELIYGDGSNTGHCSVVLWARFEYWRWFYNVDSREGYYLQVPVLSHINNNVAPKRETQRKVKEAVSEIMDLYANEILKATEVER